jgi:hypothetical protein
VTPTLPPARGREFLVGHEALVPPGRLPGAGTVWRVHAIPGLFPDFVDLARYARTHCGRSAADLFLDTYPDAWAEAAPRARCAGCAAALRREGFGALE